MKVLYIISSTATQGGSTKAFLSMVAGLKERGVDASVVCPDNGPATEVLKTMGIRTYVAPYRTHIYPPCRTLKEKMLFFPKRLYHYRLNKRAEKRLLTICRAERFDLIHTNVSVIDIGYNVAKKLHIPHIYHIREYQDLDFDMKIIPSKKRFIENLYTGHSICITRNIQKHFELDEEHSKVIYDGVKPSDALRYSPDKGNYFLFVGRLQPSKGIEEVIHAYIAYHAQSTRPLQLLVAGLPLTDDYRKKLTGLVSAAGLDEEIRFLGVRNDVDDLMLHANAVIMASHSEGFGLVTVEAMYNGALVLARNCAGTHEQIVNGKEISGDEIALPWNTTEELTGLMTETGSDTNPDTYRKMIERSQYVVSHLYSTEKCVDETYRYYNHILLS